MACTGDLKWYCVISVCLLSLYIHNVSSANILALCAVPSPSHSLWCYQYMSALSERGHQITVFGVDKPKIKIANLTTIIANHVYATIHSNKQLQELFAFENLSKFASMHPGFTSYNEVSTREIMHSPELQELINKYKGIEKPFDLIIHDNTAIEALLGLVPLFGNPPLLLATTYGTPQWMTSRVGNVLNPSFVPTMMTSSGPRMTFYERFLNTVYFVFMECLCNWVIDPFQDRMMKEVFGDGLPSAKEIARRANVIIVNHHPVLHDPRPLLPGVIGISGLHITRPKPLPKDIQEFMDGAKDGVVLLSFGTNIQPDWLPEGFVQTVVNALGQLPQRVYWKWNDDVPNLPPNVRVSKWLPQSDMMAHPKFLLFASHCGLLSTQEAIYRKIPIMALPVFLDQLDNAAMMERLNLTVRLNVFQLTTEQLRDGITEMISNPKYRRNIERLGGLVTDTPLTQRQLAVYWTEYALRHQGAAHLRAASADMPWYQLLLLDVVAVVLTLTLAALWLIKTLLVFLLRKLMPSKSKVKSRRKQE